MEAISKDGTLILEEFDWQSEVAGKVCKICL